MQIEKTRFKTHEAVVVHRRGEREREGGPLEPTSLPKQYICIPKLNIYAFCHTKKSTKDKQVHGKSKRER